MCVFAFKFKDFSNSFQHVHQKPATELLKLTNDVLTQFFKLEPDSVEAVDQAACHYAEIRLLQMRCMSSAMAGRNTPEPYAVEATEQIEEQSPASTSRDPEEGANEDGKVGKVKRRP